ncbi:MAG: ABC transporter permease subunit [Verrucomicrobiales bacterium]|nr:ABC transporter permease subunit [Verrucomicrobiales bacterium]
MTESESSRDRRIAELRRSRSKDWFLQGSGLFLGALAIWAWLSTGKLTGRLPFERRWQNFKNFLGDLTPSPVRKSDGDWTEAVPWAWNLFAERGAVALMNTIAIACAAIVLAAVVVLPFLPLASRRLGRRDPFGIYPGKETNQQGAFAKPTLLDRFSKWQIVGGATRFLFVLARAVPEYILAFLLIALLGLQVWPLVLALAIHNFGILGRLFGEVVENADDAAARQGIGAGMTRKQVFATTIFPAIFNRFLIYFFYRWETCVKDATVLGMLGLLTLGHLIALSKGFFWDQMLFFVLLGASVIMVGDLVSTGIRKTLRDPS